MDESKLGNQSLLKLFFLYGVPAIIGIAVFSVYNIIDGIFIGRAVGSDGLAAVSISSPVLLLFACVAGVVGTGGNTLVGIAFGKGDKKDAWQKFSLATAVVIVFSLLFSLFLVVFTRRISLLIGANEQIVAGTSVYLRTTGAFCTTLLLSGFFGILMETAGKPIVSMVGQLTGVALNVLLDYIFIMRRHMGLFGASLSNGIGSLVTLVIFLAVILSPSSNLRFTRFRLDIRLIGKMLGSGLSEGIGALSASLTGLVYNIVIMRRIGSPGIAAFAVIQYCFLFISSIMSGASQGMQPIVSYNHGAGNSARIKSALKLYTAANIVLAFVSTGFLLLSRGWMFSLFSDGSEGLNALATTISNFYAPVFMFYGLNDIYIGYFSAVADIRRSVLLSTVRVAVLKAGLVLLLPFLLGQNGIWLASPVSEGLTLVLCAAMVLKSLRSKKDKELLKQKKIMTSLQKLKKERINDLEAGIPVAEVRHLRLKRAVYPILLIGLKAGRIFSGRKIYVEGKINKSVRPKIFAPSHIGKFDVEIVAEVLKTHFFLLSGDYENLHATPSGTFLEMNGIAYFDMFDKTDRRNIKSVLCQILEKNDNILWFPEGTWNLSPNEIILPCYYGIIDVALKTDAVIIPIGVEQAGRDFYVNVGEPIEPRAFAAAWAKDDRVKKEAVRHLRDALATLKWELWMRFPVASRASLGEEYWAEFIRDRLSEWPCFSYEGVQDKRLSDKTLVGNRQAFAHVDRIDFSAKNAYLLNAGNTGFGK